MVLMERVSMVLLHTNPLVEGVVERREDQPEDLREDQPEDLREDQPEDLREDQPEDLREDQPEENKHVSLLKFKFENRIHYSKQILNKKDVSLEERRPYSSLWC
jgi:hypothetical protein